MTVRILHGDCLEVLRTLPEASVHCCVTSPPYFGLRDYGVAGQIGLEPTPDEFVAKLVAVFREVRRVLRDDGTLWLNLGDTYGHGTSAKRQASKTSMKLSVEHHEAQGGRHGGQAKQLLGIPWRVAFALQADGWYLRQDIIWHKPNPMPESVRDRCTKAHEYIFLLAKSERYYFDADAIAEPAQRPEGAGNVTHKGATAYEAGDEKMRTKVGLTKIGARDTRNKRSVWTVATQPFKEAHFATFPPALIEPCILAGCPPAGKRCDCDHIIETPTGERGEPDPSQIVGRAGMSRPRGKNEGVRPITKREQRWHAQQMKESHHRAAMREECGMAFDHYIRTDDSGARPLPERLRVAFMERGWITEAPPCTHPIEPAGIVLDPFGGAGTTGLVADRHGRDAVLIELNPEYAQMASRRINSEAPLFAEVT